MTMSWPSATMFSSSSVMRVAISTITSFDASRPVISRSIQASMALDGSRRPSRWLVSAWSGRLAVLGVLHHALALGLAGLPGVAVGDLDADLVLAHDVAADGAAQLGEDVLL